MWDSASAFMKFDLQSRFSVLPAHGLVGLHVVLNPPQIIHDLTVSLGW